MRLSVGMTGLKDAVGNRVRTRRRVRAGQNQPMWELRLVA